MTYKRRPLTAMSSILITLTDEGAKIMNDTRMLGLGITPEHDAYLKSLPPFVGGHPFKTELWQIMQDLGPHMRIGGNTLFSQMEIL